jgi:RsiW-degrading membrane proteinase PrsW (M82 family)
MKVFAVLLIICVVILTVIVTPIFYEVCTSAIPKLCVLLDIARLEGKVLFLFQVSFGAKIVYALAKLFEVCVKINEL